MKSAAEPSARRRRIPFEGHAARPNMLNEVSLAPMWKFTGSPVSLQMSQKGFQASSPRSGRPILSGSLHMTMPLRPMSLARCTSSMLCSMFHQGMSAIGSRRSFESAWISAIASL